MSASDDGTFMGVDVGELAALSAGDPNALRRLIVELQEEKTVLVRAVAALTILVREEYGHDLTLAEIADTWGIGVTPEQVEALRTLEMDR